MTDVAVLGTGTMGGPMAANLLAAGHAVRVWNRSPGRTGALVEAGAVDAPSPAAAVAGADVVLTMLFDLDATREVATAALGSAGADAVWLQTGTVGPVGTAELAALAAEHGTGFLDAPVLGTRKPAEDGTLVSPWSAATPRCGRACSPCWRRWPPGWSGPGTPPGPPRR
jgi:3-hydroxyisobutyrate dehydrogenase